MTTSLGISLEQKKKKTTKLNQQEEKQVQRRTLEKEKIKALLRFKEEENKPAQILMLKKFRANVLEEVHMQQELIDKLDYIIAGLKKSRKQARRN